MVILGVMASTDSLVRHAALLDPFGRDPKAFYLVPMSEMVIFAALLYFAFRNRKDSPAHKRYIYIATTSLMVAAIARWPLAFSSRKILVASLLSDIFLLLLVAYDLWSHPQDSPRHPLGRSVLGLHPANPASPRQNRPLALHRRLGHRPRQLAAPSPFLVAQALLPVLLGFFPSSPRPLCELSDLCVIFFPL